MFCGMEWLNKLEEKTGRTGYYIAKSVLNIQPQQYYRMKEQGQGMKFKYLASLLKMDGINTDKDRLEVIGWILSDFDI